MDRTGSSSSERGQSTTKSNNSSSSRSRRFVRGKLLGSGSFGRVHMALDASSGELFAVKSVRVSPAAADATANLRALENEISLLSALDCPEIIRFRGDSWTLQDDSVADVACASGHLPPPGAVSRNLHLELAPGGSVAALLKAMGGCGLDENLLRRYSRDVVRALRYLHRRGIVHGDVKGLNILLGETSAKLADFGTAWRLPDGPIAASAPAAATQASQTVTSGEIGRCDSPAEASRSAPGGCAHPECNSHGGRKQQLPQKQQQQQQCGLRGSPFWMSPEAAKEEAGQGTPSDIWSLGCTVLEMATGQAAWSEIKDGGLFSVLYAIGCTKSSPKIPETLSLVVRDFIGRCLKRDPSERWTAEQLLAHPFLAENEFPSPAAAQTTSQKDLLQQQQQQHMFGRRRPAALSPDYPAAVPSQLGPPSPMSVLDVSLSSGGFSVPPPPSPGVSGSTGSGFVSPCPSTPSTPSSSSLFSRKRGFSPLGCHVLERTLSAKLPESLGSPKRQCTRNADDGSQKVPEEDSTAPSLSFPLLDLALLKQKLPSGKILEERSQSTLWPQSPLSPQGAQWIIVRSPNSSPQHSKQ